jgi:hypothetical protein
MPLTEQDLQQIANATYQATNQALVHFFRNTEQQLYLEATRTTSSYILEKMPNAKLCRAEKFPTSSGEIELIEYIMNLVPESDDIVVEFGVSTGRSTYFISQFSDTTLYAFDNFTGLPEDWFLDAKKGSFSTNGQIPLLSQNERISMIKGEFSETLPNFLTLTPKMMKLVHIDCKLYSSSKMIFDHIAGRLQTGSLLIIDGFFNYPSWQKHVFKAFQEFVDQYGVEYEYLAYAPSWFSVGLIINKINKPA